MYVLITQSCLTLWDSLAACQIPLSMGFSKQEYWSGLPCPLKGIFLIQDLTKVSYIAGKLFFNLSQKGSPIIMA